MAIPTHLVSIGYEGRDADDLIRSLELQNVQVLVDVRLNPISRKKGLSKSALQERLASAGIGYVHHRELGNPKDNRDAFRDGRTAALQRFRDCLSEPAAVDALAHVSELLDGGSVALLCFERDHAQCHRHVVAEAVQASREGLQLIAV